MDYYKKKKINELLDNISSYSYTLETLSLNIKNRNTDYTDADTINDMASFIIFTCNEIKELITNE